MRTQLLHLVFVFTPAANLVTDKFSCQSDEFNGKWDEFIRTNSFANGTKSIAKRTNSIAKTCIKAPNVVVVLTVLCQWKLSLQETVFFVLGLQATSSLEIKIL